mmetsp:Transcript_101414/g.190885  ORF Transcript_101414/g.190885 Transcript_101414/m.190885 type:complete len:202 (+) Transcript_101414:51-656(+)
MQTRCTARSGVKRSKSCRGSNQGCRSPKQDLKAVLVWAACPSQAAALQVLPAWGACPSPAEALQVAPALQVDLVDPVVVVRAVPADLVAAEVQADLVELLALVVRLLCLRHSWRRCRQASCGMSCPSGAWTHPGRRPTSPSGLRVVELVVLLVVLEVPAWEACPSQVAQQVVPAWVAHPCQAQAWAQRLREEERLAVLQGP